MFEFFDLTTSLVLVAELYYIGVDPEREGGNFGINSYKIATLTLFLSTFSPFWVSYSALLKVALMQDRYLPSRVKNKWCFQKFLMMLFLTFAGTILLILSKVTLAFGECVAFLFYLTCDPRRVNRVRKYFDDVACFIIIDIDKFTFDGVQQLQYNSLIWFQDIPMLIV